MSITINTTPLNTGSYVLYWMQQAQRVHDNPALEYAIRLANSNQLPLIVLFVLIDNYPEANLRHYNFMLEGIRETREQLTEINITMLILHSEMVAGVTTVARLATHLVMDMGYLNLQREWRGKIEAAITIPVTKIETEPFLPVETVMQGEAYGALSIRTRMYKLLPEHTIEIAVAPAVEVKCSVNIRQAILRLLTHISHTVLPEAQYYADGNNQADLTVLQIDKTIQPVKYYIGGFTEAKKRLTYFRENLLSVFQDLRGNPACEMQSDLSPYLHFGQISIRLILKTLLEQEGLSDRTFFEIVRNYKPGEHSSKSINGILEMFEEGVIRRELSFNFCHFNPEYDSFTCLPQWARKTLTEHSRDIRTYKYGLDTFEKAETHDEFWNTAQKEMLITGKMHGYMRMYWGKKILEWCACPEEAFQMALYLNNKYELDGRDANAFAGVAWCFGKHDRPWAVHPIYGNVRSMVENGLKRKFDMQTYIHRVKQL